MTDDREGTDHKDRTGWRIANEGRGDPCGRPIYAPPSANRATTRVAPTEARVMPETPVARARAAKSRSNSREKSEKIASQLSRDDVFCRILVIGIIYLCLRD